NFLDVGDIRVDVSALNGKMGTWLLDPRNVIISNAATFNGSLSSNVFTPSGDDSILNIASLVANLANANVNVTTGASGAQAGNITVQDAITWASTQTLTLTAANNIIINAPITATSGGLTLSAVNAADSITTGASGAINVANFVLSQGRWSQNSATLP